VTLSPSLSEPFRTAEVVVVTADIDPDSIKFTGTGEEFKRSDSRFAAANPARLS
jgi:hypothetical protein